jgi:ATP-dependent phosphoenolpyruvate carboxykinase
MAFKTNRENAEIAQAAATSATLENVRIREQRSADAYAALATRDERIAAKAAALQPADRTDGEVTEE